MTNLVREGFLLVMDLELLASELKDARSLVPQPHVGLSKVRLPLILTFLEVSQVPGQFALFLNPSNWFV
jgi:hypothetical protein